MKKLILIAIAALITMNVWGQTNTFPATGNVGIGTTTPSQKLHVVHSTGQGDATHGIQVTRYTNTTSNSTNYNKAIYAGIQNYSISPGVTDSGYRIGVDASSYAGTEGFQGTLSKAYGVWARSGIHVAGTGAHINNVYGIFAEILNSDADGLIDNAYGIFINNSATTGTITNRFDLFASSSNAKNYFAGNVGIGTTAPSTKFEVLSGVSNNEIARFGGTVTGRGLRISSFMVGGTNDVGFDFNAPGAGGAAAITFSTLNIERVRINYNGNVGIGTTAPIYKLSVKGTIGCGEVKVEDVTIWADFVFEPEYNLMSLKDLETYIKANKHLPEIPTTTEVKENGIAVGEMNAKLLQKIEELTLYTIKQQELIEALQKRVDQLESK